MSRIKDIALVVLLGVVIFLWLFRGCDKPKPHEPINLNPELNRQDSFRTVIKYHDSTRLSVLKRYREVTVLKDSVPCYSEIKFIKDACDTVIAVDSVLIVSLKAQHNNDTVIQVKLLERVRTDSVLIVRLEKKVKRNKFFTKVAFMTGLGAGGFLGYKLH